MSRHPEVKWTEREDKIYLTVLLADAKNPKVNDEPDGTFTFTAAAGTDDNLYELKLELLDKVNVEIWQQGNDASTFRERAAYHSWEKSFAQPPSLLDELLRLLDDEVYNVWHHFTLGLALPPINSAYSPEVKPVVLVITSMDSASFFRDKSLGAESPISGLIALLAVVDALSNVGLSEHNKQKPGATLVAGDFFLEFDQQSDTIKGLNLTTIETVMEFGSVGKNFAQGTKTFFAHTAGASSSVNETLSAPQIAQDFLSGNVIVRKASTSNPGVGPSSLMTFLTKDVFQLIVSSFEDLSDVSSRSHEKRAIILETVSEVRSCVIMLDLECDQMIVDMFQHFLQAIRKIWQQSNDDSLPEKELEERLTTAGKILAQPPSSLDCFGSSIVSFPCRVIPDHKLKVVPLLWELRSVWRMLNSRL